MCLRLAALLRRHRCFLILLLVPWNRLPLSDVRRGQSLGRDRWSIVSACTRRKHPDCTSDSARPTLSSLSDSVRQSRPYDLMSATRTSICPCNTSSTTICQSLAIQSLPLLLWRSRTLRSRLVDTQSESRRSTVGGVGRWLYVWRVTEPIQTTNARWEDRGEDLQSRTADYEHVPGRASVPIVVCTAGSGGVSFSCPSPWWTMRDLNPDEGLCFGLMKTAGWSG